MLAYFLCFYSLSFVFVLPFLKRFSIFNSSFPFLCIFFSVSVKQYPCIYPCVYPFFEKQITIILFFNWLLDFFSSFQHIKTSCLSVTKYFFAFSLSNHSRMYKLIFPFVKFSSIFFPSILFFHSLFMYLFGWSFFSRHWHFNTFYAFSSFPNQDFFFF